MTWQSSAANETNAAKAKAKALLLIERAKRDKAPPSRQYEDAREASMKTGKPLLVIVGTERPDLEACTEWIAVTVRGEWHGVKEGVVVGRSGYWLQTLPSSTTQAAISQALDGHTAKPFTSFIPRASIRC